MNWRHFQAFLWLRWRLGRNQLKRAGTLNLVLLLVLVGGAVLLGAAMGLGFLLVGLLVLPDAPPAIIMYIWDGLVVFFLMFWLIGLLVELQRSELLSLDKFLHLPVSLTNAFVINYVGSLFTLTMVVFLPAMLGLAFGLVLGRGLALLLVLPLLAAFLLMVTALTHQFRGWLAALMANKRRRRTVIALVTFGIVLLVQLPNLVNILRPWDESAVKKDSAPSREELAELDRALAAGKIDAAQHQRQRQAIVQKHQEKIAAQDRESERAMEETVATVNMILPPGWLPYGAMAAARGNILPALLGTLGMALVGGASLWRSYKTTVRLYTGQINARAVRPAPVKPAAIGAKPSMLLLEKKLPWMSEYTSALAVACFRSLTRAPEVKMMLLSPVILVIILGSTTAFTRTLGLPLYLRPLMATAAMAMVLLTMGQLVGNQFGFDRSGFRTFVLCAAPRRDILLGKNLAVAPFALGLGLIAVVMVQVLYPMRFDHLLACVPQLLSMYLLFCLMANLLSIFAPMPTASGSLKPANPRVVLILLHMLFTFVFPVAMLPTLLPLGIDFLAEQQGWLPGAPLGLVLALAETVAAVFLYRMVLTWQGKLLQGREQKILEIVAGKVE